MAGISTTRIAAAALIGAAALTAWPANAEFWPDQPWADPGYRNNGQYRGGPYYVSGFGGDDLNVGRRYWGGPYFVSCPGRNPPYETHRPPYPRCRSVVNI